MGLTAQAALLNQRIANGEIILLDGGTGTEMQHLGIPMTEGAWCGLGTVTHPDLVEQVHLSFLEVGAEVIVANTYASSRHLLAGIGEEEQFVRANVSAMEVALAAREKSGRPNTVVAGSLSPTNQEQALPPVAEAAVNYREQAQVLADAGADILICEMLRDVDHSRAVLDGARASGLPVWAGWSAMRDSQGALGTAWGDTDLLGVMQAVGNAGVEAMLMMHTEQPDMHEGLDLLEQVSGDLPLGAYAQSGGFVPPDWDFAGVVDPPHYKVEAASWIDRGVQIIGGCCGIGPDHIAELRHLIDQGSR